VLHRMREASTGGLEQLNTQVIEAFKQGATDKEEIAANLNVPLVYIEVLSFIRNREIPTGDLANLLDVPEKHIKYLRFLLREA